MAAYWAVICIEGGRVASDATMPPAVLALVKAFMAICRPPVLVGRVARFSTQPVSLRESRFEPPIIALVPAIGHNALVQLTARRGKRTGHGRLYRAAFATRLCTATARLLATLGTEVPWWLCAGGQLGPVVHMYAGKARKESQ